MSHLQPAFIAKRKTTFQQTKKNASKQWQQKESYYQLKANAEDVAFFHRYMRGWI